MAMVSAPAGCTVCSVTPFDSFSFSADAGVNPKTERSRPAMQRRARGLACRARIASRRGSYDPGTSRHSRLYIELASNLSPAETSDQNQQEHHIKSAEWWPGCIV